VAADRWCEQAKAAELTFLRSLVEGSLGGAPSVSGARSLAVGASSAGDLAGDERARAVALVRWALSAEDSETRWDAVHAAGELALTELLDELRRALADSKSQAPSVRARAAEVVAELSNLPDVAAALEGISKDDPSWTVRRVATDAMRRAQKGESLRGDLFSRLRARIRCNRVRFEADDEPLEERGLASLGLLLPPAYLHFFISVFGGGRLVFLGEEDKKGNQQDSDSVFLNTPARLVGTSSRLPDDLKNFNEYVWTRYVEGERRYQKVDEDYALKRYGELYARGWADADAYNYGVLLFEAAFRDDARRAAHLLRCRRILTAYRSLADEEWDVVDDRLEEARDIIAEEGLVWPGEGGDHLVPIGSWSGVIKLCLDRDADGVWAHDPDENQRWQVAPCVAAFLNDPHIRRPGVGPDGSDDPLELLDRVGTHLDAGEMKEAARLYGDVLEQHKRPQVLERAAQLLQRDDMSPLLAAQLLSTIPMAGDRTSAEVVKSVLQVLPVPFAVAAVTSVGEFDEDGSQISLFINAAAGLRKRSHEPVKQVAKQIRDSRGTSHIRTVRNPFYKEFKTG